MLNRPWCRVCPKTHPSSSVPTPNSTSKTCSISTLMISSGDFSITWKFQAVKSEQENHLHALWISRDFQIRAKNMTNSQYISSYSSFYFLFITIRIFQNVISLRIFQKHLSAPGAEPRMGGSCDGAVLLHALLQ